MESLKNAQKRLNGQQTIKTKVKINRFETFWVFHYFKLVLLLCSLNIVVWQNEKLNIFIISRCIRTRESNILLLYRYINLNHCFLHPNSATALWMGVADNEAILNKKNILIDFGMYLWCSIFKLLSSLLACSKGWHLTKQKRKKWEE